MFMNVHFSPCQGRVLSLEWADPVISVTIGLPKHVNGLQDLMLTPAYPIKTRYFVSLLVIYLLKKQIITNVASLFTT